MEHSAVQFQLVKHFSNKSQFSPAYHNEEIPIRTSEKRNQTKRLLDSVTKEMPPNKTIISNESNPKTSTCNEGHIPYQRSIRLLKELQKITSLRKQKMLLNYVWNKIQQEVYDYWRGSAVPVEREKQKMFEDTRLCVIAFVIVKAQCTEVFAAVKALQPFIDQYQIRDSIPIATIESAINVIVKDSEFNNEEGEENELDRKT